MHAWHPYAAMPGTHQPLLVESARGVRLKLAEPIHGQRELIDGMSSWWAAIHGYRHPVLDNALSEQLGRMSHVMFGGLTHEPAIRLCARLAEITPDGLEHVFLCDSGSVSVEVAIKMCLQYWRSAGHREKQRLLTWRGGYHGDTFGAMSVCDPQGGMHQMWAGVLAKQVFADPPPAGVAAGIGRGEFPVLAHGPTFMGNPLASAVARASIDLLLGDDWAANIKRIETALADGLAAARALPDVADVRVLGAIGVVQLDHEVDMAAATRAAVRAGVWLRPFRDLIYTMPPYITTDEDLARITAAVTA